MGVVDLHGSGAEAYLRYLLANDVARLAEEGRALYSCLLSEGGGVLDDLIVYRLGGGRFRIVVNAATRDKDLSWFRHHTDGFDLVLEERSDLAMLAVQGPAARERVHAVLGDKAAALAELPRFAAAELGGWFIGRTGYTGEDGYELIVPAADAEGLWSALVAAGVRPCGLGARDTLRLEAGMNLYGQDMDEETTPLESGLGWTVAWEPPGRDFIGRAALERQRSSGVASRFVGLVLLDRGVLRNAQVVNTSAGEGVITSGSFSPTLGRAIALARLPECDDAEVTVAVRGRLLRARVVKPPFVRNGSPRIEID